MGNRAVITTSKALDVSKTGDLGIYELHTVMGIGEDEYCNGTNVLGMPYVDKYLNDGTYSLNINNYIRDTKVRKIK